MTMFGEGVAVITGAGSGIGRGLARRAAGLGMKVVAADVDEPGLRETEALLRAAGADVLARRTDVSRYEDVAALADAAFARFGGVTLLFNNAGVLVDGKSWDRSLDDWRWSLDVNVMGVVHGIRAFVPPMAAGGKPGIIVNTASVGGLAGSPFLGPYTASKFAVVGITEGLLHELAALHPQLRAACLCPGEVSTQIWHSERIRPAARGAKVPFTTDAETKFRDRVAGNVSAGMAPDDVAAFVFEALAAGKYWLFPHAEKVKERTMRRQQALMRDEAPVFP